MIKERQSNNGGTNAASGCHPKSAHPAFTRTIRRHQLQMIVPLADGTIYEMERRGEFPRRFRLSPRCVVWALEEVEAWLTERRQDSAAGKAKIAFVPNPLDRTARRKHASV